MQTMSNDLLSLLSERGIRRIDLANALGVDKSLVTRWVKGRIPVDRIEAVEKATGIPRHKLRPDLADIFGPQPENAA